MFADVEKSLETVELLK